LLAEAARTRSESEVLSDASGDADDDSCSSSQTLVSYSVQKKPPKKTNKAEDETRSKFDTKLLDLILGNTPKAHIGDLNVGDLKIKFPIAFKSIKSKSFE
jgi:hypothetical protein